MRKTLNSLGTASIAASLFDYADSVPWIDLWPHFLFIGLFIIIVVEIWQRFRKSASTPDISETQKIQAQPSKGRAYSIRTAQEIFESIIDCTSMHSDTIVRPYIGKWLKVNSTIKDVLEFSDQLSISVNVEMKEGSSRTIFMRFNKKRWKATFETTKIGDRLIAEGKMEEIDTHTMQLVDCDIIEIKPKESSVSKTVPPSIDPSKGDFK